jgi:2-amino-1-hydroxyethylphosphonate dioxygenase (glycine-forming)
MKNAKTILDEILNLYGEYGAEEYIGENVSILEHSLQTVELAEKETDDEEVIIAALLHDIGHLSAIRKKIDSMAGFGVMNHEYIGADLLRQFGFSEKIALLVENHVKAKRFLTSRFPEYYRKLTTASKQTLAFQGGRMGEQEALDFEDEEYYELYLKLREWDEEAKIQDYKPGNFEKYSEMILKHLEKQLASCLGLNEEICIALKDVVETSNKKGKSRTFVSDLDNTLIINDIGEALFGQLMSDNLIHNFTWSDYLRLIKENKVREAYIKMITCMAGMNEQKIKDALRAITQQRSGYIKFYEGHNLIRIPMPFPNQVLLRLIEFLKGQQFDVKVISASYDLAVKHVVSTFFGIGESNAYGVRLKTRDGILTEEVLEPTPVTFGKADVLKKILGDEKPLISAGDTTNDLYMLKMTDPDGLILFFGNAKDYNVIKENCDCRHIIHIPPKKEINWI